MVGLQSNERKVYRVSTGTHVIYESSYIYYISFSLSPGFVLCLIILTLNLIDDMVGYITGKTSINAIGKCVRGA